jgi:hypothetical protein
MQTIRMTNLRVSSGRAAIALALGLALRAGAAQAVIDMRQLGARSGDGSDTSPVVARALEQCKVAGAKKILFPRGVYEFWPDRAAEEYLFASNNDPGLKRIAFPIRDLENIEIDGQGSTFIFHGGISAFVVERSRGVTLKNFSIDWKRPFHNEARILAVTESGIDLEISGQFPYKVQKGLLYFLDENGGSCGKRNRDACPVGDLLEFDSQKRETAYMVRDYYSAPYVPASVIAPGRVRIVQPGLKVTAGNTLVFGMTNRDYPAMTLTDSSSIKVESVIIHHAGGMGILAQRCRDMELDHVKVTPSPGRMISVPADATHFVNCAGRIVMSHCLFENQLDDATNIHGIYAQVTRLLSPAEIEVKLVHPQQRGVGFVAAGDPVEFVHADSLISFAHARAKSVVRVNGEYTRIAMEGPPAQELRPGDAVASTAGYPDVVIRNSTIRNNRARGLLLGSRGKILIEDNTFHTPGAAILMEGDARYWFEQAGVRDLTIRRNSFDNCNYGVWGKAVIEVAAGIEPALRDQSRYNRNIVIEENVFRVFDQTRLVLAYSVDGLIVRNNRIERTSAYPARKEDYPPFDITNSDRVNITGK